jgi:hypothetical protein
VHLAWKARHDPTVNVVRVVAGAGVVDEAVMVARVANRAVLP